MRDRDEEQFVADINDRVNKILSNSGGDETLLMHSAEFMTPDLKKFIGSNAGSKMDSFCQKYSGFYRLMKLLEDLASGIVSGVIPIPGK